MYTYEIWDKKTSINGVPADKVLQQFNDVGRGYVYLILFNDQVISIQPHDPYKSGFIAMTKTTAIKHAQKQVDDLNEVLTKADTKEEYEYEDSYKDDFTDDYAYTKDYDYEMSDYYEI
ncbi:MAG: hypothetical protein FWC41_00265 [Firmicutes bacterium]|nr:hypothetical protein [Bacillota bacterium]